MYNMYRLKVNLYGKGTCQLKPDYYLQYLNP